MVTRRDFTRSLVATGGAILGLPSSMLAADGELRIALVLPPSADQTIDSGVALGFNEAVHAGKLFRKNVTLGRITGAATMRTERLLSGPRTAVFPHAVISSDPSGQDAGRLAAACDKAGVVFINAGSTSDALRRGICSARVFHVAPSQAMYISAARLVSKGNGELPVLGVWDSSLEKYGASQLNDRFSAQFRQAMSADAWAGWMSVKILWEAFVRTGKADPAGIASYMARDSTHFDGHKGVPLSFRSWDHQLRQPLYMVAISGKLRTAVEVPATTGSRPVRVALDALGDSPRASTCRRRA